MIRGGALVIAACLASLPGASTHLDAQTPAGQLTALGTPELRAELFDSIIEMTTRREAWSPFKESGLAYEPLAEMQALMDLIVNAATGTLPTASAQAAGEPSWSMSHAASASDSVSFHSFAGCTGRSSASSATMPCC